MFKVNSIIDTPFFIVSIVGLEEVNVSWSLFFSLLRTANVAMKHSSVAVCIFVKNCKTGSKKLNGKQKVKGGHV